VPVRMQRVEVGDAVYAEHHRLAIKNEMLLPHLARRLDDPGNTASPNHSRRGRSAARDRRRVPSAGRCHISWPSFAFMIAPKIKSPASMSRATQLTIPSLATPALFLLWQRPHHNGIAAPDLSATRQRAKRTRGKPSVLKTAAPAALCGRAATMGGKKFKATVTVWEFFPGTRGALRARRKRRGGAARAWPLPRFKLTEMQPAKSGPGVSPRQSRHPWRACFRPGVWGLRPKAKH
jgi:hypothetical protein